MDIVPTFLEDELTSAQQCMTALIFGQTIRNSGGVVVWLADGELHSSSGIPYDFDKSKWTVVVEYDWYAIGSELSLGENIKVTCIAEDPDGDWHKNVEIVAFAPKLKNPYIGSDGKFYTKAIILDYDGGDIPNMEICPQFADELPEWEKVENGWEHHEDIFYITDHELYVWIYKSEYMIASGKDEHLFEMSTKYMNMLDVATEHSGMDATELKPLPETDEIQVADFERWNTAVPFNKFLEENDAKN